MFISDRIFCPMQGSKPHVLTILHIFLCVVVPITHRYIPVDYRVLSNSWWVICISSFKENTEIPWFLPLWLRLSKQKYFWLFPATNKFQLCHNKSNLPQKVFSSMFNKYELELLPMLDRTWTRSIPNSNLLHLQWYLLWNRFSTH